MAQEHFTINESNYPQGSYNLIVTDAEKRDLQIEQLLKKRYFFLVSHFDVTSKQL